MIRSPAPPGGALLIVLVTGTHLVLINKNYLDLGNFTDHARSVLIVVKHVLVVLLLLALAVLCQRVCLRQISDQRPQALWQSRRAPNVNTVLGVVILLLTSIAQAGQAHRRMPSEAVRDLQKNAAGFVHNGHMLLASCGCLVDGHRAGVEAAIPPPVA